MRLVEVERTPFLHGSQHELPIETILEPHGSGTDNDIETVVEAERPASKSPRGDVVYMARDARTLENVARSSDFIYAVAPLGKTSRYDAAWLNRIWQLYARDESAIGSPRVIAQARGFARGYWSGRACPAYGPGHEAIWEYTASRARVIRDVTDEVFG
jgi:hypothetical protein